MIVTSILLAIWPSLPAIALQPPAQGGIPTQTDAFAKRYDFPKLVHETAAGIELWMEDAKIADGVKPLISAAMAHSEKWLGQNPLKGRPVRIIIVKDSDKFRPILNDFNDELKAAKMATVDENYIGQAIQAGSCSFSHPILLMISTKVLSAHAQRDTRMIHTLGHFIGGYLVSESGSGPPLLLEGVAGELVKTIVPKPDAIVCATSAALKDTVQGYGVFAAIGSVANNTWNDPSAWGRMLQNVVKALRKPKPGAANDKEADDKVKVVSLIGRRNEEFRRADYGFAWSVCNFLFDNTKPPKPKEGPELPARRAIIMKALADMRAEYETLPSPEARIDFFRDQILKALGVDADKLQKDWLDWGEKLYAKG